MALGLVFPHMLCSGISTLLNFIACYTRGKNLALTSAILYAVGMLVFPLYALFLLPSTVLAFIGQAQLRKLTPSRVQDNTNIEKDSSEVDINDEQSG